MEYGICNVQTDQKSVAVFERLYDLFKLSAKSLIVRYYKLTLTLIVRNHVG